MSLLAHVSAPVRRRSAPALRPLMMTVAALAVAACGGGGGGSGGGGTTPPVTAQSIAGTVVDGYIAGATVTCRSGGNVIATAISDANGKFAFGLPADQGCDTIESVGGIDVGASSGAGSTATPAPSGVLRSPVPTGSRTVSSLIVSPLTTLVQELVAGGATPEQAQDRVKSALGLPAGVNVLATDPASDVALYRATSVVAQVVEQVTRALAAAGQISTQAGQEALSAAVTKALAGRLSSLDLATLAPAPGALTPDSPLVGLLQDAASNAKGNASVAAALQGLQPASFAVIAAPLVASATQSVAAASSVADVDARNATINEQDRAAALTGSLRDALGRTASAGEAQAALAAVAAAVATAGSSGTDQPVSVTLGGQAAAGAVAGGLSNYALVVGDSVTMLGTGGTTTATLAQFESSNGVTVPGALTSIGFMLERSAIFTQLSAGSELDVPFALEVSDATRHFQAIIERVGLGLDGSGRVTARIRSGVKMRVYAKSSTSETTTPIQVSLAGNGLQIISTTGGTITFRLDRLFEAIVPAAGSSVLGNFAANGVGPGTYEVTLAMGNLRVARPIPAGSPAPQLADLATITLTGTGQSVTGQAFTGKVVVAP